jgi:predicted DNA-binding transcriptional regulator YafY
VKERKDIRGDGRRVAPASGNRDTDGSLRLKFKVSDFRGVRREILKYGSSVEVISPKELREEVAREIEKMMKVYR